MDPERAPGAAPRASGSSVSIPRLIVALQVLSLVCLGISGFFIWVVIGTSSAGVASLGVTGISIVVIGTLWALRAHRPTRRVLLLVTVVTALIAPAAAALGNATFTLPMLLLVAALAVLDVSVLAGVLVSLWLPAVLFFAHTLIGSSLVGAALNALPTVVLMGFGFVLGVALRSYEQAHAQDQRLLTERDRAAARLEEAMEKLRRATELEKELVLADERTRSARDLHDGLGHRLTAISMSLEFAQRMRDRDAHAAWNEVEGAGRTAREALAEMRTWVRALSPVRDADATGVAAFEAIAESFRGTGLEVTVCTEGADATDLELGEEAHLLLYRAVQEGLTNALRHSQAQRVSIVVGATDEVVELRIINDLDQAAQRAVPEGVSSPGFGLRGLAERAQRFGGDAAGYRDGEHYILQVRLDRSRT